MMKKKSVLLLFAILFSKLILSQIGQTCGFPHWQSTFGYSQDAVVQYNNSVYKTLQWTQGDIPGSSAAWTLLGQCNEQLLIDNPNLIYNQCASVSDWNNQTANYNTNDLVRYNYGVYRASYWVAGSEVPELSAAYQFMGVCVVPIDITPFYQDGDYILQASLSSVNLNAVIATNGFNSVQNKIAIKPISETIYTEYNMSVSGNNLSYSWLPPAYGDYNVRYTCVNSVGVSTIVNTVIKIAASIPPSVQINSPQSQSAFYQLSFAPISIQFDAQASAGNQLQEIQVTDLLTNETSPVAVQANSNYTFNWLPSSYGVHELQVKATDNHGTYSSTSVFISIIDPTIESLDITQLPNQIKAVNGIDKTFIFNEGITNLVRRDVTLFTYEINNNQLIIHPNRAGRCGLEITTVSGTKYYVGLRINNADGSVPTYPQHVSVGSVSEDIPDDVDFFNLGMNNQHLLQNNRMDVRYIYVNGGPVNGWSSWQPDRVTKFTRNSLKMGLIPFFVYYNIPDGGESYTTDLEHARDPEYMEAYFENLHLFLDQVKAEAGDEFFGVILEPDFLGYMQQNAETVDSPTAVSETTIATDAGTLGSLVQRINYEVNQKRIQEQLNMEFGWQLNLWAKPNVAGLRGIIRETDNGDFDSKLALIVQTGTDIFNYGQAMGILSNNADFVSIDKYGLDALGYSNSSDPADPSSYTWFWNNDHWMNYLKFVEAIHQASGKHVIMWQIPVGHINGTQTTNDYTQAPFVPLDNTAKHYEDSAPTFFLGDTVDFSNDLARFEYFGQNHHNDPKLIVNPNDHTIVFQNHFEEVKEHGTRLILMGAGVGESTDGIGQLGTTLTDDHFWIQKLQDYYINYLEPIDAGVGIDNLEYETPLIYPNPTCDVVTIDLSTPIESITIIEIETGRQITNFKVITENKIDISNFSSGVYIVAIKDKSGRIFTKKIVKN